MRAPAVSVIMVTHNYGRYIGTALESVFGQTYRDFEVIVIDDGSTDDTAEVVGRYLDRLSYVRREHRGHVPGRLEGIRMSRGRYLCFFDADDIYEPDKLEIQVAFLDVHPEIDFVFSDFSRFNAQGVTTPSFMATLERFQRVPFRREGFHRLFLGSLFEPYLYENFIFPGSLLVRRGYVERVGVFDESLKAKVFYGKLIRTIGDANVAYTDKVLVRRRIHAERLSSKTVLVNRAKIELYRRFKRERAGGLKVRHRLFIQAQIGKAHWRLGCVLARDSRLKESRRQFRNSLKAWPLQRLGYAGLIGTFLPRGRELVKALQRARWP